MKKCQNCGQNCPDQDVFCENCGARLPELSSGTKQKNFIPVLAGCCAAAAVIIAAAIFYTGMNRDRSGESRQTETSLAESSKASVSVTAAPTASPAAAPETVPTTAPTAAAVPSELPSSTETKSVSYKTYYVVNCQESITLRNSPSTKSSEICQIPFGSAVSYIETASDGFYKIIYNRKTGYALASYLDLTPQDEPPAQTPADINTYPTYYVVNCQESITLRKSARTSSGEICQIPLGAAVSFVENAGSGFYEIIYNGKTGYALASYLSPEQKSTSSDSYLHVVNCKESITLRKSPSTKADSFCQIPLGASVKYLEPAENGFCMISYNGYTGYVLVSYLSVQ